MGKHAVFQPFLDAVFPPAAPFSFHVIWTGFLPPAFSLLFSFHDTFVLLLFNRKGVVQRKNQMGKLAVFQPCDHLLYFVMVKMAFIVLADGV